MFLILELGLLTYFESGYISSLFNRDNESSSKNSSSDASKLGNYSNLGEWYFYNAPTIYKNNINSNDEFKKVNADGVNTRISFKDVNNKEYQQGFIIGKASSVSAGPMGYTSIEPSTDRGAFDPKTYSSIIDLYKEAVHFINRVHTSASHITYDDPAERWTDGKNTSNDSDAILKGPVAELISDKTNTADLANWYYTNSPSVFKNNHRIPSMTENNNIFTEAFTTSDNNGHTPSLNVQYCNEITYQEGDIIGLTYTSNSKDPNKNVLKNNDFKSLKSQYYESSIKAYQEALNYINAHKLKTGNINYVEDINTHKSKWETGFTT